MSERTYHTIDKTDWDPGPWTGEPDKIQWIDEFTGLDCLIVRNGSGALCGYVGVPPEHPWHGVEYGDHLDVPCEEHYCWADGHRPDCSVEVHGGLTFSGPCHETEDPSRGICHVPEPGRPDDVWWLGFDCAHAGDVSPKWDTTERFDEFIGFSSYKDVAYVKRECALLAKQLVEVGK